MVPSTSGSAVRARSAVGGVGSLPPSPSGSEDDRRPFRPHHRLPLASRTGLVQAVVIQRFLAPELAIRPDEDLGVAPLGCHDVRTVRWLPTSYDDHMSGIGGSYPS